MKAIVLAAGRGSRLHPHTDNHPKCLTVLDGMTLIERQVRTLRGAGVADIVIVTGYRAEMLTPPGTRQIHNDDWATTNMVESLFRAETEFGDDLIVAYSDIAYEPKVLNALIESPHEISVVVDLQWRPYWERRFSDPLSDAESLRMDGKGLITDIGRKVQNIDAIEGQYLGLLRFHATGVDTLRKARTGFSRGPYSLQCKRSFAQAYMTDLLMHMILSGEEIHAVTVDAGWLEIDTVEDFLLAQKMIKEGVIDRVRGA